MTAVQTRVAHVAPVYHGHELHHLIVLWHGSQWGGWHFDQYAAEDVARWCAERPESEQRDWMERTTLLQADGEARKRLGWA